MDWAKKTARRDETFLRDAIYIWGLTLCTGMYIITKEAKYLVIIRGGLLIDLAPWHVAQRLQAGER